MHAAVPRLNAGDPSTDVNPLESTAIVDGFSSEPDRVTQPLREPQPANTTNAFDDYVIVEEISRGGMGVVYKAREATLDRIVAIKMILSGRSASDEELLRFYAEAEAVAQLNHPGIVPIHRVGEDEGHPYFAMEYIDGPSLSSRIADGPFSANDAAEMLAQVCDAVGYAHKQGVIHRDLKPGNILLEAGVKPRITDFGLAKRIDQDASLTTTGQVLGTPSYMAPEQASGMAHQAGPAADIHALGAILYCLLVGRPPFQSANVVETLKQVATHDPVPLRQLNPDLPRDLETVCLKCLEKAPQARYTSAEELAAELRRFLEGRPVLARPVSKTERVWRWARRNRMVATLAMLLLAALLGGFAGILTQWLRAEATAARELGERKKATNLAILEKEARIEANQAERKATREYERTRDLLYATQIASLDRLVNSGEIARAKQILDSYVPSPGDRDLREFVWRYWSRRISKFRGELMRHTENMLAVAASKNGHLAASGEHLLAVWETAGNTLLWKKRIAAQYASDVAFGPDGTWLIGFLSPKSLGVFETSNGRLINKIDFPLVAIRDFSLSGDGKKLLVRTFESEVLTLDLDTQQRTQIVPKSDKFSVRDIAISKDGRRVVVVGQHSFVLSLEDNSLDELTAASAYTNVTLSPDGKWLALCRSGTGQSLSLRNLETGRERTLFFRSPQCAAFTQDSQSVVVGDVNSFAIIDTESGTLMDRVSTGDGIQGIAIHEGVITTASYRGFVQQWDATASQSPDSNHRASDPEAAFVIAMSPDGLQVAIGGRDSGIKIIDRVNGRQSRTFAQRGEVHTLDWSGDSKNLAWSSASFKNTAESTMAIGDVTTGRIVHQRSGRQFMCQRLQFTANGSMLVTRDFTGKIEFRSVSGFDVQHQLPERVASFRLLPDPERIVVVSNGGEVSVRRILSWKEDWHVAEEATDIEVSPDGTLLAVAGKDGKTTVWNLAERTDMKSFPANAGKLAFSPVDRTLVTVPPLLRGEGVSCWDPMTGELLLLLKHIQANGFPTQFTSVAFSPDGSTLAATTLNAGTFFYRACTPDRP